MSRRDTIIIAVLVNAALLMILFATAIRSDDPQESSSQEKTKLLELAAVPRTTTPKHDDLLNEYVFSIPPVAKPGQESLYCFEESELTLAPSAPVAVIEKPLPPLQLPNTDEAFVNITVKKGDFLEKIAKANNTTIAAIMQANHMSSTQLKIGQVLKVPLLDGNKGDKRLSLTQLTASQEEGAYYIVKEGDNPWMIASRNKINLEELLRLNGLDEQKAKRLRPGDKLKIR